MVAMGQILIYSGAIVVLFLFVVALLPQGGAEGAPASGRVLGGLVAGGALLAAIAAWLSLGGALPPAAPTAGGDVVEIGRALFGSADRAVRADRATAAGRDRRRGRDLAAAGAAAMNGLNGETLVLGDQRRVAGASAPLASLIRRNPIAMLMSIELMLNAANLLLVLARAGSRQRRRAGCGADRAGAGGRRGGDRPRRGAGPLPRPRPRGRGRAGGGARMSGLLLWAWLFTLPGLLLTALGVGREPGAASLGGPLVMLVVALGALATGAARRPRACPNWLPFLPDGAFHLRVDSLSAVMLAVVGAVSTCVYVYSLGYMDRGVEGAPRPPFLLLPGLLPRLDGAPGAGRQHRRAADRLDLRRPGQLPADQLLDRQARARSRAGLEALAANAIGDAALLLALVIVPTAAAT